MLNVIFVVSVLCIIDIILLLVMPEFYVKFGIPIYKSSIKIAEGKNINDIKVKIGLEDELIIKIKNNSALFRTKFTFRTLYSTFGFISIVKGEFSLTNNNLMIIQRMNMSTVYLICLVAYIIFTQRIDIFGIAMLIVLIALIVLAHTKKNRYIKGLENYIKNTLGVGRIKRVFEE